MSHALVSDIFGAILEGFEPKILAGVIERCVIDTDTRVLTANIRFGSYIKRKTLGAAAEKLKAGLTLNDAKIIALFSASAFSDEAAEDIAEGLKVENVMLNGYLNGAEYVTDEGVVSINLKFGGLEAIKASNFERQLIAKVKDIFGIDIEVHFIGQLEDVQMEAPKIEHKPFQKQNAGAVSEKRQSGVKLSGITAFEGANIDIETAEQIFGRKISGHITPLADINPENDVNLVCGEVFFSEMVATKTGKGHRVKFQIYDGTNSITVKMLISNNQADNIGAAIKKGNTLIVRGVYAMDDWEKDYCLEPDAIAIVKNLGSRVDNAAEKRIELHLHTSMSQMDAIIPVSDVVKRAFKWGHKAVAITDHGVVQAFPDAMHAAEKSDLKVIYGMECYKKT